MQRISVRDSLFRFADGFTFAPASRYGARETGVCMEPRLRLHR